MKLQIIVIGLFMVLVSSFKLPSSSIQNSKEHELEVYKKLEYYIKTDSVSEFYKLFDETHFNPNYQKNGITILFTAVKENNIPVCEFLIKKGADINFVSNYGTVMHWALEKSNLEMARFLLDNGYDPTIEKNIRNNKEPLCFLAMFLVNKDKKTGEDFFESLTNKGMDLNLKDKDGASTMHLAVYFESIRLIRFLHQHGLDLDSKIIGGTKEVFVANNYTPLMLACYFDKLEVVKELISLGVDLNLKSKDGKTALDIAKENKNEPIIEILTNPNHSHK